MLRQTGHAVRQPGDGADHTARQPGNAAGQQQHDDRRHAPHNEGVKAVGIAGAGLGLAAVLIGGGDDLVDDGAMRQVVPGHGGIGLAGAVPVATRQGGQEVALGLAPESGDLLIGCHGQQLLDVAVDRLLLPIGMALVIILVQLGQPRLMPGETRLVIQRQGRFQIGFQNVFRRRQDIGDQVLAQ